MTKTMTTESEKNACLNVFIRAPIKGQVKTRLAKDIGNEAAVSLYSQFIKDILDKNFGGPFTIQIYFDPEPERTLVEKLVSSEIPLFPQNGGHLGARMNHAFIESFNRGYSRVLIIGSDSPDLPCENIQQGFDCLAFYDAVIGPSEDGGYYLIGFNKERYSDKVFYNINWGTDQVFAQTMTLAKNLKLNVKSLQQWYDVDDLKDLKKLNKILKENPSLAPHTQKKLNNLSDIVSLI